MAPKRRPADVSALTKWNRNTNGKKSRADSDPVCRKRRFRHASSPFRSADGDPAAFQALNFRAFESRFQTHC